MKKKHRDVLNQDIKASEVRLINDDGEQIGIVPIAEALKLAAEKSLDVLLITEDSVPPVCKIINYGQYKYEQKKKERNARKSSKGVVVKELKLSPKISDNDFMTRVNNGRKFLDKGYKIKLSLMFRGREIVHSSLGTQVMDRFVEKIEDIGERDSDVSSAGRSMVLMIKARPKKK